MTAKRALLLAAVAILQPSITWALQGAFLWPIPQTVESGNIDINLDPSFKILAPKELDEAVSRYTQIISQERWVPVRIFLIAASTLKSLQVTVKDPTVDLAFGVDESYVLDVNGVGNKATLQSPTVWGALRGLETFSQLVQARSYDDMPIQDYSDDEDDIANDTMAADMFIPETPIHIEDAPMFSHRGLMLDTSRNYFPVFHWHITDSQSFPLRLESAPELAQHGAYVMNNRRFVYTKNDIKRIVQYARARGIRVIPEIDMPAHTGSWGMAHKDITTCLGRFFLDKSNKWSDRYAAEPTTGQLNPVSNKTYEVVNKVITEVSTLFPDAWFHGGGDEPIYKCWEEEESVRDYMQEHGATGEDLLHMFLDKELGFIRNNSKTAILWEDSVTNNNLPIPKDVVLQVWVNAVTEAAKKGYKVIASHANFWYLDCGHGGWTGNDTSYDEQTQPKIPESLAQELDRHQLTDNYRPSNWGGSGGDWCSPFKTWQRIYSYDMTFDLTPEEAKNVLGGEVALWAEQTDRVGLDGRLWPRSAAAAEVMWSGRRDKNQQQRDLGDAMLRIFDWRYRLVKRGIQAEALQPLWW
ncbi:glycoside hydrolase superfamily [Zychaea mexicana]|uniref:glycoside hydrolase superfamily n=1 Tax=Zychaea mexicana TaxID=64656 RepID=UPI0022FDB518|nr:glycoside hydrolase superfamily [Zychaea mexicana]KAI9493830.1 glycoside hydrolase superfamily [Zychaea mexicana]